MKNYTLAEIGREVGTHYGFKRDKHGWVRNQYGHFKAQGWVGFLNRYDGSLVAEYLTKTLTGFNTFGDMLTAKGNYRPTILVRQRDYRYTLLADLYDRFQEARGDDRRAYRG